MTFQGVVTVTDVVTIVFGSLGLIGLYLTYLQTRHSREANVATSFTNRATFVLEINKWLRDNAEEARFFYTLDYRSAEQAFVFDPRKFPFSDAEHHLDAILYKLSFVGSLLKRNLLTREDLLWMSFFVETVLSHSEVQKYLRWLQGTDQAPNHSDFVDAIVLYEALANESAQSSEVLANYMSNARRTSRSLPAET